VTGLACAKEWDVVVLVLVGGASVLSLLACGALLARAVLTLRRPVPQDADDINPFVHWLAALVASVAIVAIVWETLPLLFIPICA
jgi:hypothetical protein